jgi:hypothetical protein
MENAHTPANENEKLHFTQIGLAAALVLNRLRNKLQICDEDEKPEGRSGATDKDREVEKARYVEQRLKDFAAFEKRADRK